MNARCVYTAPFAALERTMRWLVLVVLTLQAATCGQKGPLTLPDRQPDASAATAAVGTADRR